MTESLAIVEEMSELLRKNTYENQPPKVAYEFVCNEHCEYKRQLETIRATTKFQIEADALGYIIAGLYRGINKCHDWVCVEQGMEHFEDLKAVIEANKPALEHVLFQEKARIKVTKIVMETKREMEAEIQETRMLQRM
jgi:hypothetical protein